jgi:hypothetical protein
VDLKIERYSQLYVVVDTYNIHRAKAVKPWWTLTRR